MISNNSIQAAIVARLKAKPALTALLATAAEVREDQYQGTQWAYPAVRVALGVQRPLPGNCPATVFFSVLCFSESASSLEADTIADVVNDLLHEQAFTQSGVTFHSIYSDGLIPAIRQDERTWRSEATFRAIVS